jgi:hypothetical protein
MTDLKIECRTPTKGRDGVTRIAKWKYDCVHAAVLQAVKSAGSDGLAFSDLKECVRGQLSPEQLRDLGSLGWHVTTVKLNMEVEGDIARLPVTPQRLVTG